jgi:hypothetical protein
LRLSANQIGKLSNELKGVTSEKEGMISKLQEVILANKRIPEL